MSLGDIQGSISYARVLIKSTNLNDHLFRMKYVDSPNCECNDAWETMQHFFIECPLYNDQRENLMKIIGEKWMSNMKSGCLNVDSDLLLGQKPHNITNEENFTVKRSLFSFLISTGKTV